MKLSFYLCTMASLISLCSLGFASTINSSDTEVYTCSFTDRSTVLEIEIDAERQMATSLSISKPMELGSKPQTWDFSDPYVVVLGTTRVVTQNNGQDGYAVVHIASDASENGKFVVTADINSVDHLTFNTRGLKTFSCARTK